MLGFLISNCKDNQKLNFTKATEKINKIINYWKRFDLSMIGRITVIKTLILPQVAFIGTILNPPDNWAEKLNNVCEKFVLGSEKISKTKLYIPPKFGGIGLINIGDFLTALKCTWLKKALLSTDDNWKITIRSVTDNFVNFANILGSSTLCGEAIENINAAVQTFQKKMGNARE
jgi:hypothetical protein